MNCNSPYHDVCNMVNQPKIEVPEGATKLTIPVNLKYCPLCAGELHVFKSREDGPHKGRTIKACVPCKRKLVIGGRDPKKHAANMRRWRNNLRKKRMAIEGPTA